MTDSLQEELRSFEKELSLLLVRFMKICDALEHQRSSSPVRAAPAPAAVPQPPVASPKRESSSFIAYS